MPSESAFDIVSEVNLQEMDNAINQTLKEIKNRFDFKGSKSTIEFNRLEKKMTLVADDTMKLASLKDVLSEKMVKRGIALKALNYLPEEKAFEGTIRQKVDILQGVSHEIAKEIVKKIKDSKLKVQASIQGEKVRISGKSKDDLQFVIQLIKSANLSVPLQFCNFRNN